jgi:hypothetical protein
MLMDLGHADQPISHTIRMGAAARAKLETLASARERLIWVTE